MAHRLSRTLAVGVAGICLFGSDPVVAQETPVVAALPADHANTSPGFPLTDFGQAVVIKGQLALVGVPQFVSTDAQGNSTSYGIVEIYEGNADGTAWTRTGSLSPPPGPTTWKTSATNLPSAVTGWPSVRSGRYDCLRSGNAGGAQRTRSS